MYKEKIYTIRAIKNLNLLKVPKVQYCLDLSELTWMRLHQNRKRTDEGMHMLLIHWVTHWHLYTHIYIHIYIYINKYVHGTNFRDAWHVPSYMYYVNKWFLSYCNTCIIIIIYILMLYLVFTKLRENKSNTWMYAYCNYNSNYLLHKEEVTYVK